MDRTQSFVPPDGGYGWIIVLATTLINVSVLPLAQCFGIIYQQEFKRMGVNSTQTSFLLHLYSAIFCILGLLGSPLLKKYDFRRVALFGTSLMTIGIFLSSFAKTYGVLICTFSILLGVGQGIMLPAIYLATNTYFKKRLTLAVSFSVTGASISNIVMPPVCHLLLKHLQSTQLTVLVLAALSIVGILSCFLLKPINTEKSNDRAENPEPDDVKVPKEELELLNRQVYNETTLPVRRKSIFAKIHDLFNLELLKERPYVVAIVGMAISFVSELNIIHMLSFILPELSLFERDDVAFALSVQSIADIIGRLAVPVLGHHFSIPPRIMYVASLLTATVGRTVMAIFYSSKGTIFFCVSLIGLAKGIKAVYQSVIIPKFVGLDKLPAANGLSMLLTGTMSLALAPIFGGVHDLSGSYVYTLHTASLLSLSCVVLWTVHFFVWERKQKNVAEKQTSVEKT